MAFLIRRSIDVCAVDGASHLMHGMEPHLGKPALEASGGSATRAVIWNITIHRLKSAWTTARK